MIHAQTPAGGTPSAADEGSPSRPRARPVRIAAIAAAILVVGLGAAALTHNTPAPGASESPGTLPAPSDGASPSSPSAPSPSPPPSPSESGTVSEPVDGPAVPDADPVELGDIGAVAPGLTAEITLIEPVAGIARGPGEVAGDALRVTVSVTNRTSEEASLLTAVVSCYFGADLTPALELREPGGRPLPPAVGAMSDVAGVYVFTVPEEARDDVTIMVDYAVGLVPLVFQGDVSPFLAS